MVVMMVETERPYLVMGLLDYDSIAFAIGERLVELGGRVIYTAQSERLSRAFLERGARDGVRAREALDLRFCDVAVEEEIAGLFAEIGPLAGVVHSIAYANPRTCMGEEFHTDAVEDILLSYRISSVSFARVLRHAAANLTPGGAALALTFDTRRVYPYYNWMGVHKAALEAIVRALARRHGRDLVRVNAISAGPLHTRAASKIPGFKRLDAIWSRSSPLPWDTTTDQREVANAAAFLLGPLSQKITGQILYVDGGASIVGGELQTFERRSTDSASDHTSRSSERY
jgi:enoyl-[acyl-carrier protein] reductase I